MVYPGDVASPPSPTPTDVPVTRTTSDGRLIVEAGEVGWVVVSSRYSQLFDTRLAADGGCDPTGCVQEYTRVRALARGCGSVQAKPRRGSRDGTGVGGEGGVHLPACRPHPRS